MYCFVVVPSKDRHGNTIPRTLRGSVVRSVESAFAKRFGGFTSYSGMGGWVDSEGRLMSERVTRIEAFCDAHDPDFIREIAVIIGGRLNQASVMTGAFNGSATFHG